MTGWISVERNIFEHTFFAREPMSEREAWLWMLSQAAWQDTQHRVGGAMVDVPRGSFMTTLREMQAVFMWRSDSRVRNFLKRLEAERMTERTVCGSRNAPKTHVTICNYNEYQQRERTKDAPKTHRERTAERSKETKINNKQSLSKESVRQILSSVVDLETADSFIAFRKEIKKPISESMAKAMAKRLHGHHDPGAVLTNSISNGWQGIFPEKIKPTLKAINGGNKNEPSSNTNRFQRIITAAAEGTSRQDWG